MAAYKLANNGVIREIDGAFIPNNPKNSGWQDYLRWVDSGGVAAPQYTLAERRLNRLQDIKDKGWQVRQEGISFGGVVYNALPLDITHMILAEKTTKEINWISKDGTTHLLTKQNISDMDELASDFVQEIRNCEIALINVIATSEDPESIDIESGWPATPYSA